MAPKIKVLLSLLMLACSGCGGYAHWDGAKLAKNIQSDLVQAGICSSEQNCSKNQIVTWSQNWNGSLLLNVRIANATPAQITKLAGRVVSEFHGDAVTLNIGMQSSSTYSISITNRGVK